MTTTIRIVLENDLAIATCTGVLRAADAQRGAETLWGTPGWAGQPAVWDFRAAEFDLSPAEVRQVVQFVLQRQPSSPPSRVAFVTGRDVDYGMARIFEAYRTDPNTRVAVFRDLDEARRWARAPQYDDGGEAPEPPARDTVEP